MIANPIEHIQQRIQELTSKVTSAVDFATVLAGAQQVVSVGQAYVSVPTTGLNAAQLPTALPPAADSWLPAIREAAAAAGIDPKLLAALVWTESGFDADAVSEAGAIGLTQLMPETAAALGVDPTDPIQNLAGGALYLRQQIDRFGRIDLALAAYNAGPTKVASTWDGGQAVPVAQGYVQKVMTRFGALSGSASEPTPAPQTAASGAESPTSSTENPTGSTESAGETALPLRRLINRAVPTAPVPIAHNAGESQVAPASGEGEIAQAAAGSGQRAVPGLPASNGTDTIGPAVALRPEQPIATSADTGVLTELAPATSLLADRIVEVTRALAAGPPPRSITLSFDEFEGLRMTISLRGTQVHLGVEGLQPTDRAWMGHVTAALTRNGFELAGDEPRGRRHFEEWPDPSMGPPSGRRRQSKETEVVRF